MTPDEYLCTVLARHRVDMGPASPVLQMRAAFMPILQEWAGSKLLSVQPSGSFAKGTAVRTGTDIDLFISLAHDTTETLQEIHNTLIKKLEAAGLSPRRQTVSIGVRAGNNTYDVDLVPAKKRDDTTGDHSLYHRKSGTARKTNIARHVAEVLPSGRLDEIKLLKIWRNQHRLEFPSFYLELSVIEALSGRPYGNLAANVWVVFEYLRDSFENARIIDPAVPSNAVSDDLTAAERQIIRKAATAAMTTWSLQNLLRALDADVATQLARSRELIGHPVEKGNASEALWLTLLQKYLPRRYEVRRAHVVDSRGEFSDQIDIVIHDRHYSPFVFSYQESEVIPAESVYAVFEVKQTLDAANVAYAHDKIASVRRLYRTSLPIPSASGLQLAKPLHHILGGILTLASSWTPPLGDALKTALASAADEQQVDLICVAGVGTLERLVDAEQVIDLASGAGARFLLTLIARLQEIATVPMIDVRAYAAWLK